MMFRHFVFPLLAAFLTASASAQYVARLVLDKKQYVAGEAVIATVSITNHSGAARIFADEGRTPWLDFIVRTPQGTPITPRGNNKFGPMKIAPGQTLARQVDLSRMFLLENSGNYSVSAVVRPPAGAESTTTERLYFSQFAGTTLWSQKVGVLGGLKTREYRLLQFTGPQRTYVYAQVNDISSGRKVATYPLGDMLTLRRPVSTVDQNQRMHTLFLTTPNAYVHCCVDSDGRLITRQIHNRGPVGDPLLVTSGNGSVMVINSIPYDPKAAAAREKAIRKATDRPSITY